MDNKTKTAIVLGVVILTALTSLPLAYSLNKLNAMKDQRLVLLAGTVSLLLAAILPAFVLKRLFWKVDPVVYASGMFAWSSVIDLCIGLELDGHVSGFMNFYFLEGEPYLKTSHGTLINYWDGTAHLFLYLAIIGLFAMGWSYREVGLYWVGSIGNSMIVFVLGILTLWSKDVKLSFLLNIPYILAPLIAGFKFVRERPSKGKTYTPFPSLLQRPVDIGFLVFFVLALAVALVRGLAVLDTKFPLVTWYMKDVDPYIQHSFGKMQALCYLFYFAFYYLCAIYGLLCPGEQWMSDWAILHAGAAAQAQFVHILGSTHHRTLASLRAPEAGLGAGLCWTINLALLLLPQLFALRCWLAPEMFGRTYTIQTSDPLLTEEGEEKIRRSPGFRHLKMN